MSLKEWHKIGTIERELAPYNYLAKHFKKIYIFTYGKSDIAFKRYLDKNIILVRNKKGLPAKIYSYLLPFLNLRELKNCDILKTNQIQGAISAVISKILFRKKLVVRSGYVASLVAEQYEFNILKRTIIFLEEYLSYNFADLIFITTRNNEKYVKKKYPFTKKKIVAINNSINTSIFKPLKVKSKKKLIGYVGRLQKDKNLVSLIKAVSGLNVSLVFVGKGSENLRLKKFAKNNGINLKIIDRIENYNLPSFLNRLDLFVFPSLHEGNPKSLLEAMACGCTVIGCDVYGVNNIIKNRKNGLLCNPDPSSLRDAIDMLLENKNLRKKLGSNARKKILSEYDFDKLIIKELRIYKELSKK